MTNQNSQDAEKEFHRTAQRNALGGYIGCNGPECSALVERLDRDGTGHKVRGAR